MAIADVVADNVRAYRLLRRLEQQDVADRMLSLGHRWKRATVSEVERGRRNVTVSELLGLVTVVGASINQLLDSRGPGRGSGKRVALPVSWNEGTGELDVIAIVPDDVAALVCSHERRITPIWSAGRLSKFEILDDGPQRSATTGYSDEG